MDNVGRAIETNNCKKMQNPQFGPRKVFHILRALSGNLTFCELRPDNFDIRHYTICVFIDLSVPVGTYYWDIFKLQKMGREPTKCVNR